MIADEPFDPPLTAERELVHGKIFDLWSESFDYGDVPITRELLRHPGAVAIVALDDDDRVRMVQQYRHPVRQRMWELPAGLMDVDGESGLAGAKRELAEEVDLVADEWAVLAELANSAGGSNEVVRVFLARGLHEAPEAFARIDEEADMVAAWVPLDEAVDAVLERRVQNAITQVGILAAATARARGWTTLGDAEAPWPRRRGR